MRSAVAVTLAALALSACSAGQVADVRRTPPPATAPAASPSPSPTAQPSVARAVYWLGSTDGPRGPRLYREFVRRPASAPAVRDAVEAMLSLEPRDPDYTSLWADGTAVRDVRREGTTAVVDLSQEATRNGGGSAFEAMSLQQLVHTVTAADPSVQGVRLLVDGEPVETLWGTTDTTQPIGRAPAVETLAPVWLGVEEGAAIDGSFGGTAAVYEATVSWQLRRGGRVVQEGFSTASVGAPGRGDWSAKADVPPGDYELWAYESSAQDGSITWLDSKSITITE